MAGPAVLTVADTIANSFLLAAATRGDRPAIREKKFGIWQPTSWRQWLQISKDIAYGCTPSAFAPATSPRSSPTRCRNGCLPTWASCAPAACLPGSIRPDFFAQVEYLINDSRTTVVFAEDEEQLDKLLTCRARCPSLQKIIVFDMEGLSGFIDPMVMSLAEFTALGRNHAQGNDACGTR